VIEIVIKAPNMWGRYPSKPGPNAGDLRWLLHDNESGALQVTHNALSSDRSHVLVGVTDSSPTLESERECDCIGESRGWAEVSLSASGIGGR
jgi:hypothetical protein